MTKNVNERAADNIRILSMAMVEKANSGHPGGAMGGADFIHILFSEFLRFDPADPQWINRDRFFLDPGHMSPMLYSVLTLTGHFSVEDIMQCDGELDHPEARAQVPAGNGDSIDRFLAQFGGKLRQLRGVELAQVFRGLKLVEKPIRQPGQ